MVRVKSYLLSNFTRSFLTLFLPFFMVVSIIYILKISNLSYKTNLSFNDFLTLFIFVLPYIFFATIPLTFIGAVINTFAKLSEENELIAIFSLNYSPSRVLLYITPLAILFSILLIIITIFIIPLADQKTRNFQSKKVYEAKLKILPRKLSQSFGKHHIFIEENEKGVFRNITMFTNQDRDYLQILFARSGSFERENNKTYLNLNQGSLYRYRDKNFQIIDFDNLKIFNNKRFYSKRIKEPLEYWKEKKRHFLYYTLISLSPLLFISALVAFGIYNPRYEKNRAPLFILLSSLIIYIPAMLTKDSGNIYIFGGAIIFWLTLSIFIFKQRLKRY